MYYSVPMFMMQLVYCYLSLEYDGLYQDRIPVRLAPLKGTGKQLTLCRNVQRIYSSFVRFPIIQEIPRFGVVDLPSNP